MENTMTLPKAVAAATEELAAMEQQLQAPDHEAGQTEPPIPEPPVPESAPELVTEPAPEPPVAPSTEPPPPSEPEEKWEHKYRRLQGKYDAEVPRLHQQVRELQSAVLRMQQAPPAPPAAPVTPKEPERLVSDEDVVNYGEDFVDIQRRIALDATREMRAQLAELKAQMTQQGSQVQAVSFETALRQAIPDFGDVNADPGWVAWLNEVDPLLRGQRRLVAQAAYERGDVEAIKGYVDLFKQSRQAPAKTEVDRTQELRRQVQPSRSASSVPVPPAQKTYTMAEADHLFSRMQQLTAQGRIDEAKRLDAEISTAYAEGRVVV
jgi:hypothetical protein